MALNWNEIRDRAMHFSKEWADTSNEEADAKPCVDHDGYIDVLWKDTIFIEIKNGDKNLDKAADQANRSQLFSSEAKRMEFLFELYEKYTADLFTKEKKKKK